MEGEITLLEPRAVLYGPRIRTFDPTKLFRHRHLNPSGILGYADHVVSRQQVLHCTLLRSRPTSIRNCIAMPWSQNIYVRIFLFGPPSSCSIGRLYEGHLLQAFRVLVNHLTCFAPLFRWNETHATRYGDSGAKNGCHTGTGSVLHCGWYIKNAERKIKVNRIHLWEWKPDETKRMWIMNFNYTK